MVSALLYPERDIEGLWSSWYAAKTLPSSLTSKCVLIKSISSSSSALHTQVYSNQIHLFSIIMAHDHFIITTLLVMIINTVIISVFPPQTDQQGALQKMQPDPDLFLLCCHLYNLL